MTDVWLRHVGLPGEEGHGGAFLCPEGAVEDWKAMGWEPGAAPEEPNPVIAENVAAQQAAAQERERLEKEAAKEAEEDDEPPSKAKTWSKTDTTSEGN
jgi:hypothetical protein